MRREKNKILKCGFILTLFLNNFLFEQLDTPEFCFLLLVSSNMKNQIYDSRQRLSGSLVHENKRWFWDILLVEERKNLGRKRVDAQVRG